MKRIVVELNDKQLEVFNRVSSRIPSEHKGKLLRAFVRGGIAMLEGLELQGLIRAVLKKGYEL